MRRPSGPASVPGSTPARCDTAAVHRTVSYRCVHSNATGMARAKLLPTGS